MEPLYSVSFSQDAPGLAPPARGRSVAQSLWVTSDLQRSLEVMVERIQGTRGREKGHHVHHQGAL